MEVRVTDSSFMGIFLGLLTQNLIVFLNIICPLCEDVSKNPLGVCFRVNKRVGVRLKEKGFAYISTPRVKFLLFLLPDRACSISEMMRLEPKVWECVWWGRDG